MWSSALQRRQSDSHPHRISTWERIRLAAATEHNPGKLVSTKPSHGISYTHLLPFFSVLRGVWGCRVVKWADKGRIAAPLSPACGYSARRAGSACLPPSRHWLSISPAWTPLTRQTEVRMKLHIRCASVSCVSKSFIYQRKIGWWRLCDHRKPRKTYMSDVCLCRWMEV